MSEYLTVVIKRGNEKVAMHSRRWGYTGSALCLANLVYEFVKKEKELDKILDEAIGALVSKNRTKFQAFFHIREYYSEYAITDEEDIENVIKQSNKLIEIDLISREVTLDIFEESNIERSSKEYVYLGDAFISQDPLTIEMINIRSLLTILEEEHKKGIHTFRVNKKLYTIIV